LKRHSQFEYRNKIYQGKKNCPALSCPVPWLPSGQSGQGKKKSFALQGRAGRADSPALMTVSEMNITLNLSREVISDSTSVCHSLF
jgi:hypothetical protein